MEGFQLFCEIIKTTAENGDIYKCGTGDGNYN